jgi:hypothetical protein
MWKIILVLLATAAAILLARLAYDPPALTRVGSAGGAPAGWQWSSRRASAPEAGSGHSAQLRGQSVDRDDDSGPGGVHGHCTIGGSDDRIASTLPPVFSPNRVPRS